MPEPSQEFLSDLRSLAEPQLARVGRIVRDFKRGTEFVVNPDSDFLSLAFATAFSDELVLHHSGSTRPMSKENFEYALIGAFRSVGRPASKFSNGNPGADVEVDGVAWSLKTQADANIRENFLHISKFKELGRGNWATSEDIVALRTGMFDHMKHYERIFSLRCLARVLELEGATTYDYELVEIPKTLLLLADQFPIEIHETSRQNPKPASCWVYNPDGSLAFELYFDGGTERKLQVRKLAKLNCVVHASWRFMSLP